MGSVSQTVGSVSSSETTQISERRKRMMRRCLSSVFVLLLSTVSPEPEPGKERNRGESLSGVEQELVTRYLLSRLLDTKADQDSSGSIVYPQVSQQRVSRPLRKLLDQAKDNIDVIDFRNS